MIWIFTSIWQKRIGKHLPNPFPMSCILSHTPLRRPCFYLSPHPPQSLLSLPQNAKLLTTLSTWTFLSIISSTIFLSNCSSFFLGSSYFQWEPCWPFHSAARGQTRMPGGCDGESTWRKESDGDRCVEAAKSFLWVGVLNQGRMSKKWIVSWFSLTSYWNVTFPWILNNK